MLYKKVVLPLLHFLLVSLALAARLQGTDHYLALVGKDFLGRSHGFKENRIGDHP